VTNEAKLLERAKRYDTTALAELYDRYAQRMYAYFYRRVGDAALAEDLCSELFVRMLRAIRGDQSWSDSFSAWLYCIAHNMVVDHYRRQPPAPPVALEQVALESDTGDPKTETEARWAREDVRAALRQLTPDQQQVLALRYGEGLKAREAARIMDKTTGAIEALQHRALAALRRILTGADES
jgi:RNA polymerase sigma-70 factor (ECF subfamily)